MLTPADVRVILRRLNDCPSANMNEAHELIIIGGKLAMHLKELEKSDGNNSDKGQQKS